MGDIWGAFLVGSSRDVGDVFRGCCRDGLDRRIIGGLNTSLLPVFKRWGAGAGAASATGRVIARAHTPSDTPISRSVRAQFRDHPEHQMGALSSRSCTQAALSSDPPCRSLSRHEESGISGETCQ